MLESIGDFAVTSLRNTIIAIGIAFIAIMSLFDRDIAKFFIGLLVVLSVVKLLINSVVWINGFGTAGWLVFVVVCASVSFLVYRFFQRKRRLREKSEFDRNVQVLLNRAQAAGDDADVEYWSAIKSGEAYKLLEFFHQASLPSFSFGDHDVSEVRLKLIMINEFIDHEENHADDHEYGFFSEQMKGDLFKKGRRSIESRLEEIDAPKIAEIRAAAELSARTEKEGLDKKRILQASLDISSLADVLSKDDVGVKSGVKRINEILHGLMDVKDLVRSNDEMQATLAFLERRMREEEISHEPINFKISELYRTHISQVRR